MQDRLRGTRPFLWADESADRSLRLRHGNVLVAPMVGRGTQRVPNGLIHDWIAAVFIPNSTIHALLTIAQNYDKYKHIYRPVVFDSRLLGCISAAQDFSMVWRRRVLFVDFLIDGKYRAQLFVVSARRGYKVTESTQLQEIGNYGQPSQRYLPPGTGSGFIWRLYVELEALALTRDITHSLAWLVSPLVTHLSVQSLTTALHQTRQAVASLPASPPVLSCSVGNFNPISPISRGAE